MLNTLRQGAASVVAKIFIGLLILSFGIWGVGDIFRNRSASNAVATVGERDVGVDEYAQVYSRELAFWSQRLRGPIDANTARQFQIPQRALQTLLAQTLLLEVAEGYGVAVSDEQISRDIVSNPAFQTAGQFDRNLYDTVLFQNGMTAAEFEASVRRDLARNQVVSSLLAGSVAPDQIVEPVYRYREERRVAEVFVIDADSVTGIEEPDDSTLALYHRDNAARYTAPEYRAVTYLELTPEAVAATMDISDARVEEEYRQRIDEFYRPERRAAEMLLYDSEQAARAARGRIEAGETFAAVAEATGAVNAGATGLGEVTREDLSDDIADAVFALDTGAVSEPLKSGFGWHIFRVTAAYPEGPQPLDEIREDLRHEIAVSLARDEVYELSNRIEDGLAGGASLETAAQNEGLTAAVIAAVDQNGRDPDGEPVKGLPSPGQFLPLVFSADVGIESSPQETPDGGYFVIRVDAITKPALRPFETVREAVLADWMAEERLRRAETLAREALEKLKGGADFDTVAGEYGAAPFRTEPFTRGGGSPDAAVSPFLVGRLFDLDVGGVEMSGTPGGGGFALARLDDVLTADTTADEVALAQLRDALAGSLIGDLLQQYQAAVERRYPVSINQGVLDSLVSNDSFLSGTGLGRGQLGGGGLPAPHSRAGI